MLKLSEVTPSPAILEHLDDYAEFYVAGELFDAREALKDALRLLLSQVDDGLSRNEVASWANLHVRRRLQFDAQMWKRAVHELQQARQGHLDGSLLKPGARRSPSEPRRPVVPSRKTSGSKADRAPQSNVSETLKGPKVRGQRERRPVQRKQVPLGWRRKSPKTDRASRLASSASPTAQTLPPPKPTRRIAGKGLTRTTLFPVGTQATRLPTLATGASKVRMTQAAGRRPASLPAGDLKPGMKLEGQQSYELLAMAGAGGMGQVWKARVVGQGSWQAQRAIKTVRSAHKGLGDALQREVDLLQSLGRPDYFPVVHESFRHGGQLYMVMDWVEGRTLSSLVRESKVKIERTQLLRIFEQIVDRLTYLHTWQPPIVFRDLKPSNVMLEPKSDHLRLVDFGISHAVEPSGSRVGGYTPGWIAPEVYRGEATRATDIYALGRVLLVLLFGEHVKPAELRDSSQIPGGAARGLPQELVRVGRRMMSDKAARRPNTALQALQEVKKAFATDETKSDEHGHETAGRRCMCGGRIPARHVFCPHCGSSPTQSVTRSKSGPSVDVDGLPIPDADVPIAPPWQQRALNELVRIRASADFGTLQCLPTIDVQPYGYQRQAAIRVLSEMRGRALIADDVGLGKTIEAGLIIKEYLHRRLARRVLIVCPPGLLLQQLQQEMRDKFRLQFKEYKGSGASSQGNVIGPGELRMHNFVIVSLATFRREPNLKQFLKLSWDLLVVDECHHIKNSASGGHKAVRRLTTRYAIFLSATPFSGKLRELWAVYSALRPGWLGASFSQFKGRFVLSGQPTSRLKQHIRELTIRRRRAEILVKFPGRQAKRVGVRGHPAFLKLYKRLAASAHLHAHGHLDRMTLMQQVCSSYESLQDNVFWLRVPGGLPAEIRRLTDADHPKAAWFVEKVVPRVPESEKVLVFSRFRKSQEALARLLRAGGHKAQALREHTGKNRHRLLDDFLHNPSGVRFLICGEGAGEGLNLQQAGLLVNYDLPWNPMKVEQRIGRVQRLGQKRRKVTVINVVMRDTVEEQVLRIMQQKLRVFNNTLGDTEQILGKVFNTDGDNKQKSFALWLASELLPDGRLAETGLRTLGSKIDTARRQRTLEAGGESARLLDNSFDGDDADVQDIPEPTLPPVNFADSDLFDD